MKIKQKLLLGTLSLLFIVLVVGMSVAIVIGVQNNNEMEQAALLAKQERERIQASRDYMFSSLANFESLLMSVPGEIEKYNENQW